MKMTCGQMNYKEKQLVLLLIFFQEKKRGEG